MWPCLRDLSGEQVYVRTEQRNPGEPMLKKNVWKIRKVLQMYSGEHVTSESLYHFCSFLQKQIAHLNLFISNLKKRTKARGF